MGQGRWTRGLTRLILLMAVLIFALPSPLIVAQGTAVFSRIDVAGNVESLSEAPDATTSGAAVLNQWLLLPAAFRN